MERILTDGEKFAIAYALKKQASRLRKTANQILAGNGQGVSDSDSEQPIHEQWLHHAKMHNEAAKGHENLANFVMRHRVAVDCIVEIPEQL